MSYKNPNSKQVTIFRARSFVADAQKGLDDFFAQSTKSIGSYWESTSSKKTGTGLSISEQNLLMPEMIDLSTEDKDFRKKVKEFFDEINTKIPHKEGLKLEIGLSVDNDKPVSKDNLPISIMDYIRWRHALGHPEVADNKDEAMGNQLISYYIFDPEGLKAKNQDLIDARDTAMEYYLLLKKDKEKLDNFLAMLGEDPRGFEDQQEKLDFLTNIINSRETEKVNDFVTLYEDPKLENKSLLEKMVLTGVLKRVGPRYIVAETDAILGNSQEEALFEIEDQKNEQLMVALKTLLQEKMAAKVQKRSAKRK